MNTDNDIFLSTDQPGVGKQLGWTHQYKRSQIAYLLLGHGVAAYSNRDYRKLVERAILWVAGRLPQ